MSDHTAKDIRKQLRSVVQENLKDVLSQELAASVRKELIAHIDQRLDIIVKQIKSTLDKVDERSKEIQGYMVRQSAPVAPTLDK